MPLANWSISLSLPAPFLLFKGVNPFDQPGVEAYKENLLALLNKPGYEKRKKELMERRKINLRI
jgi:hypothetical protein